MFLMCLILCFDIFRNPHAQNALIAFRSECFNHGHVNRRAIDIKPNFLWTSVKNVTIVVGPLFEHPKYALYPQIAQFELEIGDFRINRIQKIRKLDIFKMAGRKNSRKLVFA